MKQDIKTRKLTTEEENHLLKHVVAKLTLDEYVAFWKAVGSKRLNEILAS